MASRRTGARARPGARATRSQKRQGNRTSVVGRRAGPRGRGATARKIGGGGRRATARGARGRGGSGGGGG
jgi:hypothetical protein